MGDISFKRDGERQRDRVINIRKKDFRREIFRERKKRYVYKKQG